jgi:hypothetical protein
MNPKKTIDFKRSIKALATENDWLVEISDQKGPTERIVVYAKDGHELVRIASIIIRKDEKEVDPGIARAILRRLRDRAEKEAIGATGDIVRDGIEAMIEWISAWFS